MPASVIPGGSLRVIRFVDERERAQIASQGPQIYAKWRTMWERLDNQEVGLEAAILERKRNSSLVQRTCAENITGLKHSTEAAGSSKEERQGSIEVVCEGRPRGRLETLRESMRT
ncbi:hypothetical protein FGO68_gene13477 [Halteria grandinella]|uniref:Uncharacterized protein n=1 Tax=Halteria grandinella TaxID=5974 RepID=A0A8J8SUX0_HALGN|nr:hypothetical protein FGO68_gene13477 [Halteria grandinella]